MQYGLASGVKVNLCNNFETAKFLLFKFPVMNTTFVDVVPHMIVNGKVEKLIQIRKRIEMNREIRTRRALARQEFIDVDILDEFEDEDFRPF